MVSPPTISPYKSANIELVCGNGVLRIYTRCYVCIPLRLHVHEKMALQWLPKALQTIGAAIFCHEGAKFCHEGTKFCHKVSYFNNIFNSRDKMEDLTNVTLESCI